MPQPRICIIVPAYNEETNIERVILSLHNCNPHWQISVINDASADRTGAIAEATGLADVLTLPCNLGIGGGVQTGFKYACRNDFDIAVQFDGDGQHIAEEIEKIVNPIIKNECDVTIGSRFLTSDKDNFRSTATRRIGIKFFEYLNSVLIGQKITDNTSGFRAYSRDAFSLLARDYPDDYPEPEAIILLGRSGFRIKEVAVIMKERTGGESSITSLKSIYYMIKVTLAIFITAIRPLPRK
jgi:glycosyltransferase involved in cell wall biosynthesis